DPAQRSDQHCPARMAPLYSHGMRTPWLAAVLGLVALGGAAVRPAAESAVIQRVAVTGQAAPGGGTFGRFSVESQPVVAPVNSRGQIAFFATLLRGRASEGFFLASGPRIEKAVVEGRAAPGGVFVIEGSRVRMLVGAGEESPIGGIFAKFSERIALNDAGAVVFTAVLKGAAAPQAIFAVEGGRTRKVVAIGDIAG